MEWFVWSLCHLLSPNKNSWIGCRRLLCAISTWSQSKVHRLLSIVFIYIWQQPQAALNSAGSEGVNHWLLKRQFQEYSAPRHSCTVRLPALVSANTPQRQKARALVRLRCCQGQWELSMSCCPAVLPAKIHVETQTFEPPCGTTPSTSQPIAPPILRTKSYM